MCISYYMCLSYLYRKKGTHLDEVLCVVLPDLVFFCAAVICPMVYFDELFLLSCY